LQKIVGENVYRLSYRF